MYLLDTNTLIYFFKDIGGVKDKLGNVPPREIGISAITLYELEVGIAKSTHPDKRKRQLGELISVITLFSFDQKETEIAAQIRVDLEKRGEIIGPYDILIAATALANGATLVTSNIREFSRIPRLQIEDWL
jgi:tRNA(fMet)-specific endonuclease VapC